MGDAIYQVTGLRTDAYDFGVYYPEDKVLVVNGSLVGAHAQLDRTKDVFEGAYIVHVIIERVEG
jgi:hypothetical protein